MTNQSALVFSGIVPHPPIMVPEVGQESVADVKSSIDAMAEFTRRLVDSNAETVILISPHAPLELESFVAYAGSEVRGDFANFRAPDTQLSAPVDQELLIAITKHASSSNFVIDQIADSKLDHGTAVPLYFLLKNGWRGKVVALGYSFLSIDDHLKFGDCIRNAIDDTGRSVAFVASGDLSHRLRPDAPAGYNPGAYLFDQQVVHALEKNDPQSIVEIDPNLRKLAGECGFRSMVVAIGATRQLDAHCEVLSYEAPFGVGYLVAQLTDGSVSDIDGTELPTLARGAVETFTRQGIEIKPDSRLSNLLRVPAPCFVSLKTRDGELRGCIGTIEAMQPTLAEEIVVNAIHAATRDPRFSEVTEDELANLRYSVDVLM
ncbi:MAG TPA: AmmeMemoRadiSam system protein B, partial [Pyrinomonadaceae bacterium]|nr:AmmeMemoRadiSam system protein B [Pyrinomonadaceae bacterium]